MATLTSTLVISLIDKVTPGAASVKAALGGIEKAVQNAGRQLRGSNLGTQLGQDIGRSLSTALDRELGAWRNFGTKARRAFEQGFGPGSPFKHWDDEHGYVAGAIIGNVASKAKQAVGKTFEHGNSMYRLRQNMLFAGVSKEEVDAAEAKSWEMTRRNKNLTAVEAMELQNDARMIFGSQHLATEHVEPFISAGSFLKSYESGRHAGAVHDLMAELFAAMKSGEISGNITPQDMAKHIDSLVAMKVAYGGQVKIAQYLAAQRAAGASYLASDDKWRYGYFPAMVQEYGPGAGVMMQTTAQKILADTGHKKYAIAAQQIMGLRNADGSWINGAAFGRNPLEWIASTLIPQLQAHGIDTNNKSDRAPLIQAIAKMFPDRNAAKELTEIIVQLSKLQKDAAQMEQVHKGMAAREAYNEKSLDYGMAGLSAQMSNLATVLGDALVPAAVKVMNAFSELASIVTGLAKKSPTLAWGGAALGTAGGVLGAILLSRRLAGAAGSRLLAGMVAGGFLGGSLGHALLAGFGLHALNGGRAAAAGAGLTGAAGAAADGGVIALLTRTRNLALSAARALWSVKTAVSGVALSTGNLALDAGVDTRDQLRRMKAERDGTPIGETKLWADYPVELAGKILRGLLEVVTGGPAKAASLPAAGVGVERRDAPGSVMSAAGAATANGASPQAAPAAPELGSVQTAAQGTTSAVASAMAQVRAIVAGVDLTAEGQRIAQSLAAGIRSGISDITAAAHDMANAAARSAVRDAYSDGGIR